MSYCEFAAPALLTDLVECRWVSETAGAARILPDGCMDLIEIDGEVVIAGPDTTAHVTGHRTATGIRFHPGALPRLLGVPASEFVGARVPLDDVRKDVARGSMLDAAADLLTREAAADTTPWPVPKLAHVTARFAGGWSVTSVAQEIGCSTRTLHRQCTAVYGYGPSTLRRILRFRAAVDKLRAGATAADVAQLTGYADQAHLSRQMREFAGLSVRQFVSAANKSTEVPSGSSTVA